MGSRLGKAKLNILVSFICQVLTLVCGFIVPQLLIKTYGSETYGVTASITQFLAYISLLEGGVAGVARAALYKPLADNNVNATSEILQEIKYFFKIIGYVFVLYVVVLAIFFKSLSNVTCFDWASTALLVLVISISTFAQYFIGISYSVLLQASQRQYITNIINIITMIINTLFIVIFVELGLSIILVKLCSSIIFVSRPLLMRLYVQKNYKLIKIKNRNPQVLSQKWNALGQHIAYFLHSNTDIAVLTLFGNLKMVAVYSVYHMVVAAIQNLTSSFTAGMEAVFGDMLAKKEYTVLQRTFGYYDTLISFISLFLFSVTAALIVPFVKVYTNGVTDANYIEPLFAILLVIASAVYCIRLPYHSIIVAAGHFKQTQIAGYGEAVINILVSIVLVINYGLIGVAIGTVVAVLFRFIFYAIYLKNNIFYRNIAFFIKRTGINTLSFLLVVIVCQIPSRFIIVTGYFSWLLDSVICAIIALIILFALNYIFYQDDMKVLLQKVRKTRSIKQA